MNDVNLREVALQFGTTGVATTLVLTGAAVVADFPLKLLGMILTGIPLFVVPGIVGITDAGIETAAASARIGASTGDPGSTRRGTSSRFRTHCRPSAGSAASASLASSCSR